VVDSLFEIPLPKEVAMSMTLSDREGNRRIVKVYQDPLTCKSFEGDAWLMKPLKCDIGDGTEYWEVKFISDEMRVQRFINLKHH
jgi:hypothetical protein